LVFGTGNRVFAGSYLLVVKEEVLDGVDCELEHNQVDEPDRPEEGLRAVDQLMRGINRGADHQRNGQHEEDGLLSSIILNRIFNEDYGHTHPGADYLDDQRQHMKDAFVVLCGIRNWV